MDTTGKFDPKVRAFLIEAYDDSDTPTDDDLIYLLFDSKRVHSEIGCAHRWYDEETIVVKITDRFLQYDSYHMTGDSSASDMGLSFDLSAVKFCEAYQVMVTKYRPIGND